MVKQAASCVLASFRPSTYPRGYASVLHSLRPCWTTRLTILQTLIVVMLTSISGCLSPIAIHRAVIEYDRIVSYFEADL